jgi:hypothetical protein
MRLCRLMCLNILTYRTLQTAVHTIVTWSLHGCRQQICPLYQWLNTPAVYTINRRSSVKTVGTSYACKYIIMYIWQTHTDNISLAILYGMYCSVFDVVRGGCKWLYFSRWPHCMCESVYGLWPMRRTVANGRRHSASIWYETMPILSRHLLFHSPRIDHVMTTSVFIHIYAIGRDRFGLKSLRINPPDFWKLKYCYKYSYMDTFYSLYNSYWYKVMFREAH